MAETSSNYHPGNTFVFLVDTLLHTYTDMYIYIYIYIYTYVYIYISIYSKLDIRTQVYVYGILYTYSINIHEYTSVNIENHQRHCLLGIPGSLMVWADGNGSKSYVSAEDGEFLQ